MKRLSIFALTLVMVAASGCDALKNMIGGRRDDSHTYSNKSENAEKSPDEKLKDLEDKMKKMEDEAKARIEAENKAKAEAELKAKLEQEIRAKIEAEQKTAATQPTTQPTEKVVIVRDSASAPAAKPKGWVRICDQRGGGGPCATISLGRNIPDLNFVSTSGGERDANDMCASVQYSIPAGWAAVIYRHQNYSGEHMTVGGSGGRDITDKLNDQCTSIMWVKQ